jgi:hypothetical protein
MKAGGRISVDELKWLKTFVTKMFKKCKQFTARPSRGETCKGHMVGSTSRKSQRGYMARADGPASLLHSTLSTATCKNQSSRRLLYAVDAKWFTVTLESYSQIIRHFYGTRDTAWFWHLGNRVTAIYTELLTMSLHNEELHNKDDEIGRVCSTYDMRNAYKILVWKSEGKNHLEELDVDGRINIRS